MTEPSLPAWFRSIRYDTVGSTNDEARILARDGATEGTLVWAAEQTAGRGRRGRAWVSPPGNLYLSLVLRPTGPAAQAAQLGFVAALALADALVDLLGPHLSHREFRLKWPNDVLLDQRKIAGILLESETLGGHAVEFVILGMGVNLVAAPPNTEFPATSLLAAGLGRLSPGIVLAGFARHFEEWHGKWSADGFAAIRDPWLARASGLGDIVRVRLEGTSFTGRFLDLDEEGGLLLDAAGTRRRVGAGEIFPAVVSAR